MPRTSVRTKESAEKKKKISEEQKPLKVEKKIVKKEKKTTKNDVVKKERDDNTLIDTTAAPKAKTTAGTISRANKNRLDSFGRLVYNRAQRIIPGIQFSNKAAYTISCMVDSLLEKIIDRSLDVFSTQPKKTLTAQDAFVAVRMILPEILHSLALVRGTQEIAKRRGNYFHLMALRRAHEVAKAPTVHYKS